MERNFIASSNEFCDFENFVPAPYFRKTFDLDFVPENAEISIAGQGFYRLFINGLEITKGALAPYISNPDHYCYYDTYDIKDKIISGKNVIGIILGNGMYNAFGGGVWWFDKAVWRGAPRLSLECRISGKDNEIFFVSDESFLTHKSPVLFDDLRMGMHYDAREEIPCWNLPDFDDSDWRPAIKVENPRGDLKLCTAEPILPYREIKPVKITKMGEGYLYDFGENNAGVCRLKINAERGQKISMTHCETLKDGEIYILSCEKNKEHPAYKYMQKDIYIAKGEDTEEFTPFFTYHGFQLVYVEGITEEQATEELLTYVVMSSALKKIGDFKCSDEMANSIYQMVERTDLSNFYYVVTDCPQREKNGWTGDASLSADHMSLMLDTEESWLVWLDNIRKTQTDAGNIFSIIPSGNWGEWGVGPVWGSIIVNLPYQLYKKRGSRRAIDENVHAIMRYLEYILHERNEDGTISIGLSDWLPVGRGGPRDYETSHELMTAVTVVDIARKAEEMFEFAGYTHQARFAKGIAEDFISLVRKTMIDYETMTAVGNCKTSQAVCLYYGIFEEDEKQEAFQRLLEMVHESGDNFYGCGILGMHTLFHVLSEFGENELCYNMITKTEYPSYGYLVSIGKTTLHEYFTPPGEVGTSENHHCFCDVARWLLENVAGLKVIDYKTVEISPAYIEKVTNASAYYDLTVGRVSVEWKRKSDKITIKVKHPENIECVIYPPKGLKAEIVTEIQ